MKTEKILEILKIVAWITFIGTAVVALIQIIAFAISLLTPDTAKLITGTNTNLTNLRINHLKEYIFVVSFLIIIAILNVQVWQKVKDVLTKINLKSPFSMEAALLLEDIGQLLISIWVVGYIGNNYIHWLDKHIDGVGEGFEISFQYLFSAGIVYIISQIFKRGVELQEESELTV
jgi:Protein of unknown function (DUF2975)